MYHKKILDHYKNPRNFGGVKNSTKCNLGENPSCGDSVQFEAVIKDFVFKDIKFSGQGCAISIATASMLTENLIGKKITTITTYNQVKVEKMLGLQLSPARAKCALLPVNILKKIVLSELKRS